MPKVIYRAQDRESLHQAVAVLRSAGLSPIILGDPNPGPRPGLKVSYYVEVAVPDDEVEPSLKELTAWEAARTRDVDHLTRPVWRWFWIVAVAALLVSVGLRLLFPDHGDLVCMAIPIVGLGGLLLYHYVGALFPRRKRDV